jgi:hypothetical protein
VAGLVWLAVVSGCGDSRPTRSECLIGYDLDWSKVGTERRVVRNAMAYQPEGDRRIVALAGYGLNLEGTRLYVQFKQDCDKKAEMAAALIAFWESEGLDLPAFNRLAEPIVPSTRTMDPQRPALAG